MTIILPNLNQFKNLFTGRFFSKFAVKWILRTQPHLAYVATPPCETFMSAEQAINDKLQGSVATCLRCGGVDRNEIRRGECVSEEIFKIGEYLAKSQARAWLSRALCAPGQHTAKRRRKCTRQITFFLVTLPNIHRFEKKFPLTDSAINLS